MVRREEHDGAPEELEWWRDINWTGGVGELLSALERLSCLHPLAVVARKRLDVFFYPDIARAVRLSLLATIFPGSVGEDAREEASLDVSRTWLSSTGVAQRGVERWKQFEPCGAATTPATVTTIKAGDTVAPFLSVRTAFDLYLKALALPRGSLVVCSALTIPDMVKIFLEHGLVPLPVDLDPNTLAPDPGALESEVEKASDDRAEGSGTVRAIYVAHVFGAQVDITPIAEAAARHGLLLWEDCAQVFTGLQGYLGHPASDAVFFSFGVIKRATAFGGGVVRIGNKAILSAMQREEARYPAQSPMTYLRRVFKCSMLLACTSPLLFGILVHLLGLLGVDHDKVIMKFSHGFPKKGMLTAIRHRPCVPLLQMLAWRIGRYTPDGVEARLRYCDRMLRLLDRALPRQQLGQKRDSVTEQPLVVAPNCGVQVGDVLPGIRAHRHTLWLFPVMVAGGSERADDVVEALLREGFDATRAPTSLMPIDRCMAVDKPSEDSMRHAAPSTASPSASCLPRCSAMMDSLVYLPLLNNIPDSEWDRLALALARALSTNGSTNSAEGGAVKLEAKREELKRERPKVSQRLAAFALRLDTIVLSTLFVIVSLPVLVLVDLLS